MSLLKSFHSMPLHIDYKATFPLNDAVICIFNYLVFAFCYVYYLIINGEGYGLEFEFHLVLRCFYRVWSLCRDQHHFTVWLSLPTDLITVKAMVCLAASITAFHADAAVVQQNQWILLNFWRVRFLDFPLHQTSYFSLHSLLIHSPFT